MCLDITPVSPVQCADIYSHKNRVTFIVTLSGGFDYKVFPTPGVITLLGVLLRKCYHLHLWFFTFSESLSRVVHFVTCCPVEY